MKKNLVFKNLRIRSGLSQEEFAEKLGVTQPYIQAIETDKGFSVKKAMQLCEVLGVDSTELINAVEEDRASTDLKQKNNLIVEEPNFEYTKTNGYRNVKRKAGLIPFYNADFIAGNAELFYEDGAIYPEYYLDVPEFSGCTAFRAFSDSMEKIIRSGSTLFGTKVEEWQSHLEFGQIYGITCRDNRRYLKYIRRCTTDSNLFLLKSENVNYDDFTLPKSKIKNIWLIEGWINKTT